MNTEENAGVPVPEEKEEAAVAQPQEAPAAPSHEEQKGLNQIRDEQCKPAALEILQLVAGKEDLLIGMIKEEDAVEYYSDLYMEAVPILQKHNIKMDDVKYTFQIAMQAINLLQDRVDMTLELMYNQCTASLWGVPDTGMVTINDVDRQLRKTVADLQKKNEASTEKSTGDESVDEAGDSE